MQTEWIYEEEEEVGQQKTSGIETFGLLGHPVPLFLLSLF